MSASPEKQEEVARLVVLKALCGVVGQRGHEVIVFSAQRRPTNVTIGYMTEDIDGDAWI